MAEATLSAGSNIKAGAVWALFGMMIPGVFLAGGSYQKMLWNEEKTKELGSELNDFRIEVKGEFKEVKDAIAQLREQFQVIQLSKKQ